MDGGGKVYEFSATALVGCLLLAGLIIGAFVTLLAVSSLKFWMLVLGAF